MTQRGGRLRRGWRGVFLWGICAAGASAQTGFYNFETAPVHPVDMTPDGAKLLVANLPDGRLDVFTLGGAMPVLAASIPVGIDPVSVRARTNTEAWVVNQLSDSVSIVSLTTMNVLGTLNVGDEPSDVVFAGAPAKAWVSVSGLDQVRVFDAANPTAGSASIIPIVGRRPAALATDGARVYAAIFFSGNRSMALTPAMVSDPAGPAQGVNPPSNTGTAAFSPPIAPGLPPPPATGLLVNREVTPQGEKWKDDAGRLWDAMVTWNLAQNAVAVINASTQAVTYARNLGNLQTGIAVNPVNGKVTVAQAYLPNEHRFEDRTRATLVQHRLAFFDPLNPPGPQGGPGAGIIQLNQHLLQTPPIPVYKTSVTPAERMLTVAGCRGIVWKSDGVSAYISGMESNNVIKTTAAPVRQATIAVGQGPTGLALDAPRSRLYVYNRFDNTVSVINTSTDVSMGVVNMYDPTPATIKSGRPIHYDSHLFSGLGHASCNSCHIDTRSDMQAWDLGNPAGAMQTFDQTCDEGLPVPPGACADWHPMKGPLMTQTLQGIIGNGPMHWRGDRADITAFTVGFTGLLNAAAPPTLGQMQQLGDFYATIHFPPQPNRTMMDGLPASVAGLPPGGDPASGDALFHGPPIGVGALACTDCHALGTGGGVTIVSASTLGQSQGLKAPQLRNLYTKTGYDRSSQSSERGYGFGHDGSAESLFQFMQSHFTPGATDQQRRDLEAFLMCFPTGTHPAVGAQVTVTASNKNGPSVVALLSTFTALADSGAVGLVAHGLVGGVARGYEYLPAGTVFQSDLAAQTATAAALRAGVVSGNEMTFTVVAAGTQRRLGIDRDADGYFDRDEIAASTDPADPLSHPQPPACPGDVTGDNAVGLADIAVLIQNWGQSAPPAPASADLDASGSIGLGDVAVVIQHWGQSCP